MTDNEKLLRRTLRGLKLAVDRLCDDIFIGDHDAIASAELGVDRAMRKANVVLQSTGATTGRRIADKGNK